MDKYFIGLDSGTSGIKAVLFDTKGREIIKAGYPLTPVCHRDGWYEEDMDEIWEKARLSIQAITENFKMEQIAGIGITAQGDGLWLLDEDGRPVRNGCCFCDGRGTAQFETWTKDGTARRVFMQSGTRVFTGNQPCIVKWMEDNELESLKKTRYIMHLKDVLFYRLTKLVTTDVTDQSLVFLDIRTGAYSQPLFAEFGLSQYMSKYPQVRFCEENYGTIDEETALDLGLSPSVIVSGGPMDVAACALGAGVMNSGECCSIMGTAALHEMVIDEPCRDSVFAGMTVFHAPKGKWLRLMASLAGTPNLEWLLNMFGASFREEAKVNNLGVYEYAQEMAERAPIGAGGVIYHPYLLAGGERAPFTDPDARACFTGLSVSNTRGDLLRAVYEGVAYAMYDCYCHMAGEIRKITVCGGGASSSMWCQMFADVLGKEVVTVSGEELGAKGAALANMVIQGIYPGFEEAVAETVHLKAVYKPDMEKHQTYMRYYSLYLKTRQCLPDSWRLRHEILHEGE